MNETKYILLYLLKCLVFGTTALAAVHAIVFVWLTGFVYQDNIRGYVPAGLTGMMMLCLGTLLLLYRLAAVARRHHRSAIPYIAVGCLSAPAAVLGFSVYISILIPFVGQYSWQKDVTISALGGVAFTILAFVFHGIWLSKKADNKKLERTRDTRAGLSG